MAELRIGLIGYGAWTREGYLPALRRDGRARIAAVVAPSQGTRSRARAELGSDVILAAQFENLPTDADLDAVMIAVPDAAHESALRVALAGRAAVFYEPPVSNQRARMEGVLALLLDSKLVTFADLELGFIPAVARAGEIVASGALGGVQTVTIRLQSGWGPLPGNDLSNTNHLSTWYIDALNRVIGGFPRRVQVLEGHGLPGRRQNRTLAHFDYGGVWGVLDVNIASVGELSILIRIEASDGDLEADLLTGAVRWRTRNGPAWTVEDRAALQPYAGWPGLHECVAAFLDAVERGQTSVNGAETVARLQRVGLAAEESVDTGTWVTIR